MNITEIRKLVEIIKENDLVEFELDEGDFSIRVRRGGETVREVVHAPVYGNMSVPATAHAAAPALSGAAAQEAPVQEEAGVELIKSPMVGTFYRAPSPESEPFTKEGAKVASDSVVCIIEAMKVMNEIQAETAGTIIDVLVNDGDPVEFGQPLFKVKA